MELDGFDYLIGSAHAVRDPKGRWWTVDATPELFARGVKEGFGGDALALAEAYYDQLCEYVLALRPTLVGHFDLIRKFNAGDRFLDVYKRSWPRAGCLWRWAAASAPSGGSTATWRSRCPGSPDPPRSPGKMCIRDRLPLSPAKTPRVKLIAVTNEKVEPGDVLPEVKLLRQLLEREGFQAVSYTHLDVYKRQLHGQHHEADGGLF